MNLPKKTTIYMFIPIYTGAFDTVIKHEGCKEVEAVGNVLTFTDKDGNCHKTSLPWEVIIEMESTQ